VSAQLEDGSRNCPELLVHGLSQLVDPRGSTSAPLSVVEDAYVWIRDGEFAATGAMADLPAGAAALLDEPEDPRALDWRSSPASE
jgi:hypothetical protein